MDLRIDPETGERFKHADDVDFWFIQLKPLSARAGRPRILRNSDGPIEVRNDSTDEYVWDELKAAEANGEDIEGRRIIVCGYNHKREKIIEREVESPPDGLLTIKAKTVQEEALQFLVAAVIKLGKQHAATAQALAKALAETRGVTIVKGDAVVSEGDGDGDALQKAVVSGAKQFFAGIASDAKQSNGTTNGTTNGHS